MPNDQTPKSVLARIKSALGIQTNRQLAYALGVTQQAVYHAQKNAVPMNWVVGAAQAAGVSVDWLLFGGQGNLAAEHAEEPNSDPLDLFRVPASGQFASVGMYEIITNRVLQELGLTSEDELARTLDVPAEKMDAARKNGMFPPDWLLRLTRLNNIDITRVLPDMTESQTVPAAGSFDPLQSRSDKDPDKTQPDAPVLLHDYCLIPKCNPLIVDGGRLQKDASMPPMAFVRSWLSNWGDPAHMALLEVSGEHLEPMLFDGDMVLLDCSKRIPMTGRFFAVGIDGHALIRRIDLLPGRIVLCSENKKYEPLEIPNDLDGFTILGMAVWFGRRLVAI